MILVVNLNLFMIIIISIVHFNFPKIHFVSYILPGFHNFARFLSQICSYLKLKFFIYLIHNFT